MPESFWLVMVLTWFVIALIMGIGIPYAILRAYSQIQQAAEKAKQETREMRQRLNEDAQAWINTQGSRITSLQKSLDEAQGRIVYLEAALERQLQINTGLGDQVNELKAEIVRLQSDRDSILKQLEHHQMASDVYRATLVVLITQMRDNGIRPKVNSNLLEVIKKDRNAGRLLELVEEYLNGK